MPELIPLLIILMVAAWVVNIFLGGYKDATAKPLPMRDNGHGAMEPICPACSAKLVVLTRKGGMGLTSVIAIFLALIGVIVLLFHWLAGFVVLILAVLLGMAGKNTETVLTCPACGQDAKRLT